MADSKVLKTQPDRSMKNGYDETNYKVKQGMGGFRPPLAAAADIGGPVQSQSRDARPDSEHYLQGNQRSIPTGSTKLLNGGY